MASIPPGSEVVLRRGATDRLAYPPEPGLTLLVAVHEGALHARSNLHTQLVGFLGGEIQWAGALGEGLLDVVSEGGGDPRMLLADHLAGGDRLWEVVRPGDLLLDPARGPLSTVYLGSRPWVVVGELPMGDLLAVPLGDAGNPMWFTPILAAEDVRFPGSHKSSQAELAHLWSLPASMPAVGSLSKRAVDLLGRTLREYF